MGEIVWKTPDREDYKKIRSVVEKCNYYGSDTSALNIYLLRKKYGTKIGYCDGFILRKYYGKDGRCGYGFPVGKVSGGELLNENEDLKQVFEKIKMDAACKGEPLRFCLFDKEQKEIADRYINAVEWKSDRGNSDYIYIRQELAQLSGSRYHKKRNHVLKFTRLYNDWRYAEISERNISDAMKVADEWFEERMSLEDKINDSEYGAIVEAVEYYSEFGLRGGILYADGKPVAMTIASPINKDICDVHFEKAVGKYAADGAYAVINRVLAISLSEYTYFNREEDINIEGLRKAKMSYHPWKVLEKYSGEVRG